MVWDAVQGDRGRRCFGQTSIASQSLFPGEAIMGTLRTGEDGRWHSFLKRESWRHGQVEPLMTYELHTGASLRFARPVSPEQRSGASLARMQ